MSHRSHIPSRALRGPLLALAALALGAGILTGIHFGHPWWFYPCHAALVAVMTGACAFVALILPTAWRRWAWPLIVTGQFSLLSFAYVAGYLGRTVWGTNVPGRSIFRNLPIVISFAADGDPLLLLLATAVVAVGLVVAGVAALSWFSRSRGAAQARWRIRVLPALSFVVVLSLLNVGRAQLTDRPFHKVWVRDPILSTLFSFRTAAIRESPERRNAVAAAEAAMFKYREVQETRPIRRRLIVFIVDALRPDRSPVYGYHRDTTPFLSSLEKRGHFVKVERAYTVAPESIGGITSILSPRWPRTLAQSPTGTVMDALAAQGFRTHLFVVGDHSWFDMDEVYGRQQLTTYHSSLDPGNPRRKMDDRFVLDQLAAVSDADEGRDLIVVHLMVCHETGMKRPVYKRWKPDMAWKNVWTPMAPPPTSNMVVAMSNDYDNRVLQADDLVRQAWAILARKGYLEDAVVAIVADHGQSLGEHGYWGHTRHVSEPILRIPMLFWSDEPLRVDGSRLASTIDVGPTLLAEAGLRLPDHWEGRPLLPPHRPRTVVVAEDLFYETRWQAVVWDGPTGPLKYFRLASQGRPAIQELIFHLGDDPAESRDVFAETPAHVVERLRQIARERLSD